MAKAISKRKRSYKGSKKSKTTSYKKRKTNNKKKNMTYTKKMRIRKAKGNKIINVKNDQEVKTRTFVKKKVTKQQQKLINRRFKNGFSPFVDTIVSTLQEVTPAANQCKWLWRSNNGLDYVSKAFKNFPQDIKTPGSTGATTNIYQLSQEQAIYFGMFEYKYEILNPTNYDMNLVVYDIVYKKDYLSEVGNANLVGLDVTEDNPISLIHNGLGSVSDAGSAIVTADPTAKTISDIALNPTESYPFNIGCKVIRKHTYRLQPGATMVHKFVHKPKNLMTRGYYGYNFRKDINDENNVSVKDLTSGCLFKFWGQIANTNNTDPNDDDAEFEVANLSGKLAFKEYYTAKWYCMDEKYTYTFRVGNGWSPTDAELAKLEVINNMTIKTNASMDTDATNNG